MSEIDIGTIPGAESACIGTVILADAPENGWYVVEIDLFPGSRVTGTALRLSRFAVGEKVTVFQAFWYGNMPEFGFAKRAEYGYGVAQIPPSQYGNFADRYKYGMILGYLCNKAFKTRLMFEPGRVQQLVTVGGVTVGLRVATRMRGSVASLGVTPAITDLSVFEVGDGVLISHWPGTFRQVVGWWQTVKDIPTPWPDLDYQYFIGGTGTANTVIGLRTISTGILIATFTAYTIMQAREGFCAYYSDEKSSFFYWFVAFNVSSQPGEPPLAPDTNARLHWMEFSPESGEAQARLGYADFDTSLPQTINLTITIIEPETGPRDYSIKYNYIEAIGALNSPSFRNNIEFQNQTLISSPGNFASRIKAREIPEVLP